MVNINRRDALKLGGLTAALGISSAFIPCASKSEAAMDYEAVVSKHSNPGVSINFHTYTDKHGATYEGCSISIDEVANAKLTEQGETRLGNLSSEDSESLKNIVDCLAGPYTSIGLVGSAANSNSPDTLPKDLDVLVLNGNDSLYETPGFLYDNQQKNISKNFRGTYIPEVIDLIKKVNPDFYEARKDVELKLESVRPTGFVVPAFPVEDSYDPTTPTEFLVPNDVPFNTYEKDGEKYIGRLNRRPVHLISPRNKENLSANLDSFKESLDKDKAVLLYKGDKVNFL